jgi:UPF0755 protein
VPRQKKFGRIKLVLALLLVVASVAIGWYWQSYLTFANRGLALSDEERVLNVDKGDGFSNVLAKIRALGVTQGSDLDWKTLAITMHAISHLQVGEYAITPGLSPRKLIRHLREGVVIQHPFTIVEGWNIRDLRTALDRDTHLLHKIDRLNDAEVMKKLDRAGDFPEGRFLPETYNFTRGGSDLDILKRAADAMDKKLADVWAQRDKDIPLKSPDELLTLASIIEKETGRADERPMIAGVFVRRLEIGMRLQTDPTVIYGMGSAYNGNIRKTDLETDTPYNTYTRNGLPPTPIAMPGREALLAAAHPAAGDALYFVARGNGAHYFSATLAEHNAAVAKYQLNR